MDALLTVLVMTALVIVLRLRSRVARLEQMLAQVRDGAGHADTLRNHAPASHDASTGAAAPGHPVGAAVADEPFRSPGMRGDETPQAPRTAPAAHTGTVPPPLPPLPRRPGIIDTAITAIRSWFTEGNVPVKVGMLVLFAGVAALLKYASDQGFLQLPIEFRLAGVAAAAVAGLVFGWRQRYARRAFGLALQGGSVGVLLLVVFAAAKLYALIPVVAAFAASVALVAGLCVLAVRQDALALAMLGVVAGFLAPIWLSTGTGNHVALFGYYAVLNAGIVAIAWRRPWRLLNVLGFVFTFGIGTLWGALSYRSEHFRSTEPFLLLFFAMYLAIPLLYAANRVPVQRRVLDGCLIFGTPLVAFSLQAGLLEGARMPLAFCALGLAALYALLAAAVRRRPVFADFVAPYAVLAVGFATLAVPLAVSAQATGAIFALEGAGLVWLGLRQERRLPLVAGFALQAAAAVAVLAEGSASAVAPAILNGPFMASILIALSGFASAAVCHRAGRTGLAVAAYLWALAWWCGTGLHEISRAVRFESRLDVTMIFIVASGWFAAEAWRRLPARALTLTATLALAAPLLIAFAQAGEHAHPFAGVGAIAWLAYAAAALRGLVCLRDAEVPERALAHSGVWLAWAVALSFLLEHGAVRFGLDQAWRYAAVAAPWLALAAALWRRPALVAVPAGAAFATWRGGLALAVALVLTTLAAIGLFLPGAMRPLPYVPLIGPLELSQLLAIGLALALCAPRIKRGVQLRIAAGAGFLFATSVVLRATHQWGGAPWNDSMLSTGLVQTSLTVLWSVLGMAAWVHGSRRGRRGAWQLGAVLMAVVLAKLVLVDRQYLGNLLGIGSFLAFGLLCTAVGYLAPVPPRTAQPENAA